jgi:predicted GIY-YIG superfamily endonuclease
MTWTLYIVRCRDGSHYTGITNDLARRLTMHDAGTGARYTRGRGPVVLVYVEACDDRGAASRREWAVKQLSTAAKRALVASRPRPRRPRVKAKVKTSAKTSAKASAKAPTSTSGVAPGSEAPRSRSPRPPRTRQTRTR